MTGAQISVVRWCVLMRVRDPEKMIMQGVFAGYLILSAQAPPLVK